MASRSAYRGASQLCSQGRRCPSHMLTRRLQSSAKKGAASIAADARKEGDISSVFRSLSGGGDEQLDPRYRDLKQRLLSMNKDRLVASWSRLLESLEDEVATIREQGSKVIPEIDFRDIERPSGEFRDALKRRGVAVIRGVIPEQEARGYKEEIEAYVRTNPWTRAFPPHAPAVYELYWSSPQIRARAHPNMIAVQKFLMKFWHSNDPAAAISTKHPLTYADRLRIRQPGDAGFALGPHVDGGSVERWEDHGYGVGGVYDKIWQGDWESYDAWESSCRLNAVQNNHQGLGACSMFRMFQGWLSLSTTGPNEGTLLVNPLLSLSTAYFLLRPFFTPISPPNTDMAGVNTIDFLSSKNWILEEQTTSLLQGAYPGAGQELQHILHPHLDLASSMVHVPKIHAGDYVAWHCDTIHAVDKVHQGKADSSVMYIPVCPATEGNAEYLLHQRGDFFRGTPAPDFPGGKGESEHHDRPSEADVRDIASIDALRAFGLEKWDDADKSLTEGQTTVLKRVNKILGFA